MCHLTDPPRVLPPLVLGKCCPSVCKRAREAARAAGRRRVGRFVAMVVLAPAPQVVGGPPLNGSHVTATEERAAVSTPAGPRHAKLMVQPRQPMQRAQQSGRRQRLGPPQRGRADTVPYREHASAQQAQQLAARLSSNAAATSSGRMQPPSQRPAQRTRQQRPVLQTAVSSNNPRDWKVCLTASAVIQRLGASPLRDVACCTVARHQVRPVATCLMAGWIKCTLRDGTYSRAHITPAQPLRPVVSRRPPVTGS